ncbi:BRO-N domain-containing protein [Bacillus mycoides]|uniref:BRO-N domain-containing protein n=1 Tax=Bacillus mycoides TaxID=1405 RepID=UPI003CF4C523
MSNQLQVIHQQEVLGQGFKVYGTKEETLFLAKDVATWIGHTNLTVMMRMVEKDDKVKAICELNNSYVTSTKARDTQEMYFLTEDGIYELLMLSRKPIAKQWKKEVMDFFKVVFRL